MRIVRSCWTVLSESAAEFIFLSFLVLRFVLKSLQEDIESS